jgi:hypothetical protein
MYSYIHEYCIHKVVYNNIKIQKHTGFHTDIMHKEIAIITERIQNKIDKITKLKSHLLDKSQKLIDTMNISVNEVKDKLDFYSKRLTDGQVCIYFYMYIYLFICNIYIYI